MNYHTHEGQPYWFESAYYVLNSRDVEAIETATAALHQLCLQAIDEILQRGWLGRLGIPDDFHRVIKLAWDHDPPSLYGRFDLAYTGDGPPKLLEYNADTPTALLEAAVIQWKWLEELFPGADQFNSIWEGLVEKFRSLRAEGYLNSGTVHFAHEDSWEDFMTVSLLRDAAHEAGLQTTGLFMNEISWDEARRRFVDLDLREIETLFKLYPWENMLEDEFAGFVLESYPRPQWIEPIWKLILSSKAILPILWELYPDHPNLLPAYFETPGPLLDYVEKPFFSREGQNITIHRGGRVEATVGDYGGGPTVYQAYAPLFSGSFGHTVIGSWVVDGEPRGVGIRESDTRITTDLARFVPHRIA